jgi:hypothetical protein
VFHIHHIDNNTHNNSIENLSLVEASAHLKAHQVEWKLDVLITSKRKDGLKKARELAKEWHKSDEGRDWHSANSIEAWKNKKTDSVVCKNCGASFETYFPTRAKFCCVNCHHQYKDRSKAYFEDRKCQYCGKNYETRRSSKAKTCSMKCAAGLRDSKNKRK